MFAVISRCVAHSYIIISLITADDALKADVWLHSDHDVDNTVEFQNIPSMMFTMETILHFSEFTWVKANIRAVRLRAISWRYHSTRMLPPRPEVPTSRSCEVTLVTAPMMISGDLTMISGISKPPCCCVTVLPPCW